MKQISLILLPFLFILTSCGPSAEEIATKEAAKEKAKQDSITIANYKAADEAKKKKEEFQHTVDSVTNALLLQQAMDAAFDTMLGK